MARLPKQYLTREERDAVPYTHLGMKIREHYNYPVDFPIPPQLPPESILPAERDAVLLYHKYLYKIYPSEKPPEYFCPIHHAPPAFAAYVDECCEDLAEGGRNPEMDVNHWLYPGFYVADGHVVGAILFDCPPEFVKFPWPELLALDMRGYRHDCVPPEVCAMRHLKLLFAGRNQMKSLPPAIGNLTALRALTIQETPITALPEEFCWLHSLIYFNCRDVPLDSLPPCVGDLISLQYLILDTNKLTALPESIGNLQNLRCLNLEFNHLSDLPASLASSQNLEWINLENNHFSAFPAPLAALSCAISFTGNPLRSLYGVPQSRYREIVGEFPARIYKWKSIEQYDAITAYYTRPLLDIVESLVHDGTLPEFETERLLHEATPAIRQYLETHLPPTHPIIAALAEHWAVEIPNDPDHHQILL